MDDNLELELVCPKCGVLAAGFRDVDSGTKFEYLVGNFKYLIGGRTIVD